MNKEDYFKYYIQGSDHYLIPKDVFKELFNEMINWKEESKQLKEVINKAVLELVNIDGTLSNGQLSDRICNLIDILNEVLE